MSGVLFVLYDVVVEDDGTAGRGCGRTFLSGYNELVTELCGSVCAGEVSTGRGFAQGTEDDSASLFVVDELRGGVSDEEVAGATDMCYTCHSCEEKINLFHCFENWLKSCCYLFV